MKKIHGFETTLLSRLLYHMLTRSSKAMARQNERKNKRQRQRKRKKKEKNKVRDYLPLSTSPSPATLLDFSANASSSHFFRHVAFPNKYEPPF